MGQLEVAELLKFTSGQIQDGGRPQIFHVKISVNQPRIVRFRSNLVLSSLVTSQPIYFKCSRWKSQKNLGNVVGLNALQSPKFSYPI